MTLLRTVNSAIALALILLAPSAVGQCSDQVLQGVDRTGRTTRHQVWLTDRFLFEGLPSAIDSLGSRGLVYVRERVGDRWPVSWVLPNPAGGSEGGFGTAILPLSDEPRVLVGDPARSTVWELYYDGVAWRIEEEIRPPVPETEGFGSSLAWADGILLVGAPGSSEVVTFEHNGDRWVSKQRLRLPLDEDNEGLGISLSFDEGVVAIGAASGRAVFLWRYSPVVGWTAIAKLVPPPEEEPREYGHAVLMTGSRVVVTDPAAALDTGRAYVYDRGFGSYDYEATLVPWDVPDGTFSIFGWDVAPFGDAILVQAMHGRNLNGATYAFGWNGSAWVPKFVQRPVGDGTHMDMSYLAVRGETLVIAGASNSAGYSPVEVFSLRRRCLCPADFNEDGLVNPLDVTAFLNAWVPKDGAADVDQNGVVDSRDVVWFLAEWNGRQNCIDL